MTNSEIDSDAYPFYGLWNRFSVCSYTFLVHPKQKFTVASSEDVTAVIVGHALDPLSNEKNVLESDLAEKAASLFSESENAFHTFFNGWTGLFNLFLFTRGEVRVYGDAAGMYMTFYGECGGNHYCSSHTNLLKDVCNLEIDEYVERLVNYRFYHLFGKSLPGDISPYKQFKRLIPNHYALLEDDLWKVKRFFPKESALIDKPYDELIDISANILSSTMKLIHQKWDRPAISLTGGCDSKTTLSCTNGVYDKYRYFSYTSQDSESVDATAAHKICELLEIPHTIYTISEKDEDYPEIEDIRKLLQYNSGDIGKSNPNDVRKRAFFLSNDDFDVEVKSWVSEIARAYYHKRFSKKKFPKKLTAKYATSLYKVFITDRKLVRDTNKIFSEFLEKYYRDGSFDLIPWYDLFFWEFRIGSWNGLVITGEQQIAYDIAIPYNNRVLLQHLLSTPLEKRIKDEPHKDIMKKQNKAIYDSNISVVNVKHTDKRACLEKMYLSISSKLPF